ncbi:hypothetical protein [Actinoplanes subtropicus]|uniref:hypothetical protein n=1 Tax=Actinoplanes subtropicus TaxID=543632 RepID=UPI0004C3BB7F|nr:hypothetical protein [Actinoplanes subtropicus]
MSKKRALTLITLAGVLYHLAAFVKDGEQWLTNARQARDNPSLDTLATLVLATGIVVIDFGRI